MATPFAQDFIAGFQASAQRQARQEELDAELAFRNRQLGLLDAFRTSQLAQRGEQFQQQQSLAERREERVTGQEAERIGILGGQLGLGQERLAETVRSNLAQEALRGQEIGLRADIARQKAAAKAAKVPDVSSALGKVQGSLRALSQTSPEGDPLLQGEDRSQELALLRQDATTMVEKGKLGNEAELITELKGGVEGFQPVTREQAIQIVNQDRTGRNQPPLTRDQSRILELFFDTLEAR